MRRLAFVIFPTLAGLTCLLLWVFVEAIPPLTREKLIEIRAGNLHVRVGHGPMLVIILGSRHACDICGLTAHPQGNVCIQHSGPIRTRLRIGRLLWYADNELTTWHEVLCLPHALATSVLAGIPLAYFTSLAARRRHRRRHHRCQRCAYDLTGNTSGVCPECGTAISTARASDQSPAPPPEA